MAEGELGVGRGRSWARIVGGVVIVLVGALAALASLAAMSLTSCEAHELSSATTYQARSKGVAVVVPSGVLELEGPSGGFLSFCGADFGHLTVEAEAEGTDGKRVFMGTASPGAAVRYLGPARYTRALSPEEDVSLSLDTTFRHVGRDLRPVSPPAAQRFWLGRAEPIATATSRLRHSWRYASYEASSPAFWLVLVNEDGSPGVAAELRLHLKVAAPSQWPYLMMMLVGVVLAIGGIVLARSGRRAAR